MEELALVPVIERLLQNSNKESRKEGINLMRANVGVIGPYLTNVLTSLLAEKDALEKKELYLLISMVFFYIQRHEESIEYMVQSDSAWINGNLSHDSSLSLYFTESKNRVIRKYIEECKAPEGNQNQSLKEFVMKLVQNESALSFNLLGLFVFTRDIVSIERFISGNASVLYKDEAMAFLTKESKKEKCHAQVLQLVSKIWENNRDNKYCRVFFKTLADKYLAEKNDDQIVSLLEYLIENRKEIALYLAFLIHDKSPIVSQRLSSRLKDKEVHTLLVGKFQSEMYQEFLTEKNKTNFALLSDLSKSQSIKLSMNHMALSLCNGIMNCKTENDTYLRKNVEWMRYARNWSRFIVSASFGMIHSDKEDPFEVLRNYLPSAPIRDADKNDPESGGALFALGLISVNSPAVSEDFLSTFLDAEMGSNRTYVLHGACMGVGLTQLGTSDEETVNKFKNILYADTVIQSEAAAYGIGLTCAGQFNSSLVSELLTYAKDTEHEKISRAVGVAIALQSIEASITNTTSEYLSQIDKIVSDANAVIRYAGVLSLGAAYVGTEDFAIVKRLLSIICTDPSEDVKRIAVFSIGLILSNSRKTDKTSELYYVLEPLAQSHSPYVRAGVALTLGIFLVGTGCKKALKLIEVLMYDSIPYVRQHGSIGAGFLLMQLNAKDDPEYKQVVEHMHSMTKRKSEGGAARFGALLGRALLDSCGRNGILDIYGMSGDICLKSVCGMIMFFQFWYWYPVVPFLSLCMRPTLLLAVDTSLNPIEEYAIQIEGPETPYLATTILPAETKRSHKKFKTLPLTGEKAPEEPKPEQPAEEQPVEAFHIIRNFDRITLKQQQNSSLAQESTIIFLPSNTRQE
ncbi:26S proteasome regulatory subunit N2 [Nematocida sp. AWRm80]|nr:26S proteasome regulatory subunit N2 [Nematocida sp. AWRm80]